MTENYKTQLGRRFNIKLTTIMPLHIGNGSALSPLGQYHINKGVFHFINEEALAEKITIEDKINDYIKRVINGDGKSKQNVLATFIHDLLKSEIRDFYSDKKYAAHVTNNPPVELGEFIKTDGQPFIPGSSIKGAIRTAILYDWLYKGSQESQRAFDNWWWAFNDNFKKGQRIENKFFELVEEKFFGSLKDRERLAMSCFKVTDCPVATDNDMAVYEMNRLNLVRDNPRGGDLYFYKECIEKERDFNFTISLDYLQKQGGMHEIFPQQLNHIIDPQKLCKIINQYSKAVLEYERSVIENNDNLDESRIEGYIIHLDELLEQLQHAQTNTAYMRLGYGKLQFYQTMAMIVFENMDSDENNNDWSDYLRYCAGFPKDDIGFIYPVTRTLTALQQYPMGWVKLKIL